MRGRKAIWLLSTLAVISASIGAAQVSPADAQVNNPHAKAQQDTPAPVSKFESRTDLVLVPVVVRDSKGGHIRGLNKEAFSLKEKGKTQEITLFEEVLPDNSLKSSVPDRGYGNVAYDSTGHPQLTIIVLDLLNMALLEQTEAKARIADFLEKGLVESQPVSLLKITSDGLQQIAPITANRDQLLQALKKMPIWTGVVMFRRNQVGPVIQSLRDIGDAYAGIPGRKSLILAGTLPELQLDPGRQDFDYTWALRQMGQSLMNASISVYPVVNWALPSDDWRRPIPESWNLHTFAGETGGNICFAAQRNGCLADAVEDSRSYYTLGFHVRSDDRKPGWRDLKVSVAVEHADVRARSGFYYGPPPKSDPTTARTEEINALASAVPKSDVPMYVKVLEMQAASGGNNKKTVSFMINLPLGSVRVDASKVNPLDLEVGGIAITVKKTKEAGELLQTVRGSPSLENLKQWAQSGIQIPEKLDLPVGTYDMRFFVRDMNSGQIGTVVFPLSVE
ncbi:MAG TPA: VWA domain-containing protein [Candidatus Sulfotelmatobacter sp.]|nr:VWA domain-containing protein [Candidatus Sulfotelmatobacter sp.]